MKQVDDPNKLLVDDSEQTTAPTRKANRAGKGYNTLLRQEQTTEESDVPEVQKKMNEQVLFAAGR
jgi:hypothetical protein